MNNLPYCKSPCKNCPFRKDILQGWLGKNEMTNILESDSFICHKTTHKTKNEWKQCAGFMIIKENDSAFVQLASLMNIDLELEKQDLIFDTKKDCITHHTN